jgi:nicotinate-nucleotide adenylyltransferase
VRLGVLGGTFDPVHLGHVAMAEAAADCAGLDMVLLIPASVPPHRAAALAAAEERLEMCRLAVIGHSRLQVSDLELRRSGPSYTVDTLEQLTREHPDDDLHLLLGWDAAREIGAWHSPGEVMRLARLVIVSRPGYAPPSAAALKASGIEPARALLCDTATPDVESTDVRRLIERGAPVTGLVGPAVQAYIRDHGLYRLGSPHSGHNRRR